MIHGEQDAVPVAQPNQQQPQQSLGQFFGLASQGLQEVIIVTKVVSHSDGTEPRGDRSSATGEHDPHDDDRQPPAISTVQSGGEPSDPLLPFLGG